MSSYQSNAVFLNSDKVRASMNAVVSSSILLQNYSNQVIETPTLDSISQLPDLPKHQQAAVSHANLWLKTVNPQLSQSLADIIDFGNTFTSSYSDLSALVPSIMTNPTSKANFISIMKTLVDDLNTKDTAADKLSKRLNEYYQDLYTDNENFDNDYINIKEIITSDNGEIAALTAQIEADHQTILNAGAALGLEALGIITGGAEIVVGVVAEGVTGGAATALVVLGVVSVAGSIGAMVVSSIDEHRAIQDLAESKAKLTALHKEVADANGLKNALAPLVSESQKAVHAADSLNRSWSGIANELQAVIDDLNSASPLATSNDIAFSLNQARLDWVKLVSDATTLQQTNNLRQIKVPADKVTVKP